MKLIWEPSVYLVSTQEPIDPDDDSTEFWDFMNDHNLIWEPSATYPGETLCEIAGRLCYMSFNKPRPGGSHAFFENILSSGHGSVLEHAVFGFIITGISRSLSHELVRHRAGMAYSQLSQRYVDESDVAFVVPPALFEEVKASQEYHSSLTPLDYTPQVNTGTTWTRSLHESLMSYRQLSDELYEKYAGFSDKTARRKAAREAARSVLPNATETKIFVTGNARAWRNFLDQRATTGADAEIRRLALLILGKLKQAAPNFFENYDVRTSHDGITYAESPYHKV